MRQSAGSARGYVGRIRIDAVYELGTVYIPINDTIYILLYTFINGNW